MFFLKKHYSIECLNNRKPVLVQKESGTMWIVPQHCELTPLWSDMKENQ